MEAKDKKKVEDQTIYTEIDPTDVYLDYEAVRLTAENLGRGILRAIHFSGIQKKREKTLKKNPTKRK